MDRHGLFRGRDSVLIFSLYLVLFNKVPLDSEQTAYFARLTAFDHIITALIGISNTLGAISLFRLHKRALTFFASSLAMNVALTFWHIVNKGFIAATAGILPIIMGWGLLAAIIGYTAYLAKKRTLQ